MRAAREAVIILCPHAWSIPVSAVQTTPRYNPSKPNFWLLGNTSARSFPSTTKIQRKHITETMNIDTDVMWGAEYLLEKDPTEKQHVSVLCLWPGSRGCTTRRPWSQTNAGMQRKLQTNARWEAECITERRKLSSPRIGGIDRSGLPGNSPFLDWSDVDDSSFLEPGCLKQFSPSSRCLCQYRKLVLFWNYVTCTNLSSKGSKEMASGEDSGQGLVGCTINKVIKRDDLWAAW